MTDRIVNACAMMYGVTVTDIMSRERRREVSEARSMAMYLLVRLTGMPMPQCAEYFHRTRASAIYSVNRIEGFLGYDRETRAKYLAIKKYLNKMPNNTAG